MTSLLNDLRIFKFGDFIPIDNVLTGTRKLVQVTESGTRPVSAVR